MFLKAAESSREKLKLDSRFLLAVDQHSLPDSHFWRKYGMRGDALLPSGCDRLRIHLKCSVRNRFPA